MTTLINNFKNTKIAEMLRVDDEGNVKINYGFNSGGYESNVFFITEDGGVLGIQTVIDEINKVDFNDPDDSQWFIVGYDVNYENHDLYDSHTGNLIEAAYEAEAEEE